MSDLAAALQPRRGPGTRFDHRDHVRLGWSAIVQHGPHRGEELVCALVRIAARANGFEDRYHETITRFWCRQVTAHLGPIEESFDDFYERNRRLHDASLVYRHYSRAALATSEATEGWMEPDLEPER